MEKKRSSVQEGNRRNRVERASQINDLYKTATHNIVSYAEHSQLGTLLKIWREVWRIHYKASVQSSEQTPLCCKTINL
jgi:hypothetical protein